MGIHVDRPTHPGATHAKLAVILYARDRRGLAIGAPSIVAKAWLPLRDDGRAQFSLPRSVSPDVLPHCYVRIEPVTLARSNSE